MRFTMAATGRQTRSASSILIAPLVGTALMPLLNAMPSLVLSKGKDPAKIIGCRPT
jgi:hypothetical protein